MAETQRYGHRSPFGADEGLVYSASLYLGASEDVTALFNQQEQSPVPSAEQVARDKELSRELTDRALRLAFS